MARQHQPKTKSNKVGFGKSIPSSPEATPTQRPLQPALSQKLTPALMRSLQTTHGNQYVMRLAQSSLTIQPKLTVTPAGDRYEQEADQVSKQVVSQLNTAQPIQRLDVEDEMSMQRIQRQDLEDEVSMQRIQRMNDPLGGMSVDATLESQINGARGGGAPLPDNLQRSMGDAFGTDFSGVRVHHDSGADQLNRSVQAKAFTTGADIFFKSGEYNPGSQGGQKLLAHELTHVVQQGGAVNRKEDKA